MITCPNCGTECADDMKFCLNCGTPLGAAPVPAAEEVPAPAAEEAPAPAPAPAPAAKPKAKVEPVPKAEADEKKGVSVFSILSLIFAIIAVFAGGMGCLLSFVSLGVGIWFYIPGLLAVIFGLIGIFTTGKNKKKKGKVMAIVGLAIGALTLILWWICYFAIRSVILAEFGTVDAMTVIREILSRA